jgi:hypothetical protein
MNLRPPGYEPRRHRSSLAKTQRGTPAFSKMQRSRAGVQGLMPTRSTASLATSGIELKKRRRRCTQYRGG